VGGVIIKGLRSNLQIFEAEQSEAGETDNLQFRQKIQIVIAYRWQIQLLKGQFNSLAKGDLAFPCPLTRIISIRRSSAESNLLKI